MKLTQAILIFKIFAILLIISTIPSNAISEDSLVAASMSDSELETLRSSLIDDSIILLHEELFDSLFRNCDLLISLFPEDPVGYFIKADAYGTIMRDYRIRVYDSQFDSLLELTILKAEASIKTKVSPENLFILGAALGYRSLHKYRGGKKISAIYSGVKSLDKLGDALIISPEFTDPLLGLALYEYGKIKIRRKILGKFGSNYSGVIHQLERVRRQARFVNYNSLYSMQMIYFESGNMSKALEINTILLGRFPENPSVLYNRALILENLGQAANAVIYWKHLIARIQSRTPHSNGYLAECHFKLARYYYLTNMLQDAQRESALAQIYLEQYISLEEMDGPYESFEQIKKNILQLN